MARLTRLSLRHPKATLSLLALLTAIFAAGLPGLTTDVGYRAFLGSDHPSVREFDAFLERFGGGLPLVAVWSCNQTTSCDSALDPAALRMAADVAHAVEASPAVRRAQSPATTMLLVPTAFGPVPRRLVEDGSPVADHLELAVRARQAPGWVGQLISRDGVVGAIALELSSSESEVALAAYAALDRALAPYEARGFVFHRVGGPVEFVVAGGELEAATARMIPVMVLLVGATLFALFRSIGAALCSLITVGIAVVWALGAMSWLGWPQNSLTQTLPPLILVIGVCDAIHLVARYASEGARGVPDRAERRSLLERVARDVGPPCLMTSLTTAAGFLSFLTADLESFVRFGIVAAFGVMAALLLSFSLLPILLQLLAPDRVRARRGTALWENALGSLCAIPRRRGGVVIGIAALLAAVGAFGMTRLRVDASFEELYGETSQVVRWVEFVAAHLRRPDTLEVQLRLPDDAALADPASLAVIEGTSRALSEIDELGRARSLLDSLAWSRRMIRGDDPAFARYSGDRDENRALLAMVAAFGSDVGEDGLARWVDAERRHVRISLESGKPPQAALRRVMAQVDATLAGLPAGWSGLATGPLAVVHDMIDAIRATQLRSFAAAAVCVLAMLSIFLRSPARAALALVPTALPIVLTLGVMGLAGIPLDVGSAMVAAVVLGIAVDDAIHLLDDFRRRQRSGTRPDLAIEGAVLHVGRALVTTSLALALGFSALALSPWQSVASFGSVSTIAILAALASTLLVLPALVLLAVRLRRPEA